jgi:prepilin-type N-terminal cleavage/methylation domain-containing protein
MKQRSLRFQSGFSFVEIILVIVIIVLIAGVGWYAYHRRHEHKATVITNPTATKTTTMNPNLQPLSSGTDNQSLSSDLTNIQGSMNQDNQNLNSSNAAVNDQQNEITVPTN